MLLYLARHGETEWNRLGRTQGNRDTNLTPLGCSQAEKLGSYLKNKKEITEIYCSDLMRAKKTAEIIGDILKIKPICSHLLKEISFGVWEGLTISEIESRYPGQLIRWRNELTFAPQGGESLLSVAKRANLFINYLTRNKPKKDQEILAISHSVTIKVLIMDSIEIPMNLINRMKINQTGLSLLNIQSGENNIQYLNNHILDCR